MTVRRIGLAVALAAIALHGWSVATLAAPPPGPASTPPVDAAVAVLPAYAPPAASPPIVGVNYHGAWDDMTPARRAAVLDALAAAGVRWVRLDVAWRTLQPTGPGSYDMGWGVPWIDRLVDEIDARGMKTLMMLYWAPRWSSGTDAKNGVPRSAAEYGAMTAWAADRWRGKVGAIEVWNEPDLDRFLANTSVKTHTELVKAAYRQIKAVNPGMIVVAGAPTYVGTAWWRGFYANGGADHYDALGVHPYVGMADAPPETCDPKWVQYYPCDLANLVALMRQHGDGDKRIWATEYGWSSHPNTAYGPNPPNWKRGVTERQQGEYLLRMQEVLARWPQVQASFWYTDVNTAVGDAQEDNYGLLRRDLTRKPVYDALRCAAARRCGDAPPPPSSTQVLVPAGASWRYLDTGNAPGSGWRTVPFDDTAWQAGRAQLGYGEGDERTVVRYGGDADDKHISTHLRVRFDVSSPSSVTRLRLRYLIDDGAAFHLNGRRVHTHRLPDGPVRTSTLATGCVTGSEEGRWHTVDVPVERLLAGANVLAASVHQCSRTSSDVSFDAELLATR
jgi:hypothetical protein